MAFHLLRYQLANKPQAWSLRNKFENFKRSSRSFLERFFRRNTETINSSYVSSLKPEEFVKLTGCKFWNIFRGLNTWPRDTLVSFIRRRNTRRFGGVTGASVALAGFALSNKSSILTKKDEMEELAYEIRAAFAKVPPEVFVPDDAYVPSVTFDDLEIGEMLAVGSNAVVYSASKKKKVDADKQEGRAVKSEADLYNFLPQDLAVKLMFNYSAQSDAATIWKTMVKEALPAIQGLPYKTIKELKNRAIPAHPNIVQMHCAFVDQTPLLPDAMSNYPQALPLRLAKEGYGRNMTLFIVMRRYHCSLRDYLQQVQPSTRTSIMLFCQLLEGLVHLRQHCFAHRDLKTDNVLLNLSHGVSNPSLVITDFGCCLDNLELPFPTDEVNRGGNMALMAPEIATAEPGPFTVIDYSRSDLWTLGTMAYEIFGGKNPFYSSNGSSLESSNYMESELPELPFNVPPVMDKLIKNMLHRDPAKRPSASFAATICQLYLHTPPEVWPTSRDQKGYEKLNGWLAVLSAASFFKASSKKPYPPHDPEFHLQYTFCRRMQFSEVYQAVEYMSDV